MSYGVEQTRCFARQYKKLHRNTTDDVDIAVETIAGNPSVGERKKGDLVNLLVFKFRSQGQLYLLGYTVDDQVRLIYLEAVGPQEPFLSRH